MLPFIPVMRGGQEEQMFRRGLAWLWGEPTLAELELLLAFFASFILDTPFIQRLTGWILGWCPSIACIKWLRSDICRLLIEPVAKVRGHTTAQQLLPVHMWSVIPAAIAGVTGCHFLGEPEPRVG